MLLTLIAFIFVLGILVFVHELGHFIAAKRAGIKVEEFAIGIPPRIFSIKKGETRYTIGLLPIGGYVKMLGELEKSKDPRAFENQSPGKRFVVSIAGVVMNLVLSWVVFSILFGIGVTPMASDPNKIPGGEKVSSEVIIYGVLENSAAASAGIEPGDIIMSGLSNGEKVLFSTPEELSAFTKENAENSVIFDIKRQAEDISKEVVLGGEESPLGVSIIERAKVRVPWYLAPIAGLYEAGQMIKFVFAFLGDLVSGIFTAGEVSEEVGGPVAIYVYSGVFVRLGAIAFLQFIAALSVNLALINILPLPALDGGRVIFIVAEKLFGKKVVKEHIENIIHGVGYAILIALILLLTFRDIGRYF